jgi:hypothetical protein
MFKETRTPDSELRHFFKFPDKPAFVTYEGHDGVSYIFAFQQGEKKFRVYSSDVFEVEDEEVEAAA